MAAVRFNLQEQLIRQRAALGISFASLAARSGVSEPTVKRIFGGQFGAASCGNVAAVARALGATFVLVEADSDELCREQARIKAEQVARLVQGSNALEGQAADTQTYNRLVEKSYHELLAGPKRRLWSP